MKKLGLALLTLGLLSFATYANAADEKKSRTKKPEVTVEETHPDRDHTVEADDVDVKRDKTVYSNTANAHTMNVRMGPIALLLGVANVDLDFKLSKTMTLGPTVEYISLSAGSTSVTAYKLGVRMNFYPGGGALSEDGWYVGPSLNYVSAKATSGTKSVELSGGALAVLGGYQWMWDSFNIMLGGGFIATSIPSTATVKDSSNGSQEEVSVSAVGTRASIEFNLGFAF